MPSPTGESIVVAINMFATLIQFLRFWTKAESSKRIHLVMEYADGGNLCSYVKRRKRLDEEEARRILQQLLEGVSEVINK